MKHGKVVEVNLLRVKRLGRRWKYEYTGDLKIRAVGEGKTD